MAAVTIYSDFGAPQNKVCHCFHCFPILREISPAYSLEGLTQAEAPIFWSSAVNSRIIGKVPDAGKD